MRLIDADAFMNVVLHSKKINSECTLEENAIDTYDNGQQETFEFVIKMLEKQPTAYNVDKVVEELEEERELSYADFNRYVDEVSPCLDAEYDDTFSRGLERAVRIVKGG